jgi:hypothetical protein
MTRRSLVLSSLHGNDDIDEDTMIDLQGWMYWQASEKTSILGKPSWKRKWIVLTPDAIFIYKSDKVRGLILMMEADFCRKVPIRQRLPIHSPASIPALF